MILTPLLGLRAVALALRGDGLVDSKLPGAGLKNALMEQVNNPVESSTPSAAVELKRMNMPATLAICSSGWLIPGLGHVLIGRWVRGAIFAACVLLMFVLGLGMHGKLYDLEFDRSEERRVG